MTRLTRLALATFIVGFLTEAATEVYQFVSYGLTTPGPIELYYVGLVTTGIGFYLMYRGRHEWTDSHRRSVRRSRRHLRAAVGMFLGAFVAIVLLGVVSGDRGGSDASLVVAGLVGALVTLSLGNFFLSLATLVNRLVGRAGHYLAWAGFVWSLGVAVFAGYLVGEEFPSLLHEFITNPLGLIVLFAPIAFVIAPLFVSYFLFAAAYWDAYRQLAASFGPGGHSGTLRAPPAGAEPVQRP